jgi:hypothetical protein
MNPPENNPPEISAPPAAGAAVPRPQPPQQFIMTSRFSTATIEQNKLYRKNTKTGCIYCSPSRIAISIPQNAVLFVLELNISTNKINGIGMLKNKSRCGLSVYDNGNYNRYAYAGNYRIDVDDMTEPEKEFIAFLEPFCFKGKYHMKRGSGITKFPQIVYKTIIEEHQKNILDFIKQMFRDRMRARASSAEQKPI